MGAAAVDSLIQGHHGTMIGIMKNQLVRVPLEQVANDQNHLSKEYLDLATILAN
jgi:6-phosphofructokinase